jgi:hypothetical protein
MKDRYDVFISYSSRDAEWVRGWLLPRLEAAGLNVCIDFRDFDIGAPALDNMELAVERSAKTLIVLTPNWIDSEWTNFEALLTQTQDPAARRRRLVPLMLEKVKLPARIAMLTYADFTTPAKHESEIGRVIAAIKPDAKAAPPYPTPADQGGVSAAQSATSTGASGASQSYLTRLRENLTNYFSEGELQTICFDLGEDYDNLPGDGKSAKAREMVAYFNRRGRLEELIALCEKQRPNARWRE